MDGMTEYLRAKENKPTTESVTKFGQSTQCDKMPRAESALLFFPLVSLFTLLILGQVIIFKPYTEQGNFKTIKTGGRRIQSSRPAWAT
jgi:hypothetical protein